MNEFVFMGLGAFLVVMFFWVYYALTMASPPKKGYAITYPTLEEAADAYTGEGVIVRLDIYGPEPLSLAEVMHAGARYLWAIRRAKKARDRKERQGDVVIQFRGPVGKECPIPGCSNDRAKYHSTCLAHIELPKVN